MALLAEISDTERVYGKAGIIGVEVDVWEMCRRKLAYIGRDTLITANCLSSPGGW